MQTAYKRVPQRAELLSLFLALLVVLIIAILSYRGWRTFTHNSEQLFITQQVVTDTNDLLSALKDAETGQRGFLLTGRELYLEPYQLSQAKVPAALKRLRDITVTRPDQARRVEALRPLVKTKLEELQRTIDLRRNEGEERALAVVQSDQGKAVMDQIRKGCDEIQRVAYGRLTDQTARARANANQIGLISTGGAAFLFLLLILSTITIQRATQQRQHLIQELHESGEQTKKARDLLQTTITSIGDGVIATDATGRVTFLNSIAESLTGWPQEQAAGKPLEEIFIISHEETGAPAENPVSKSLRDGRVVGLANHTELTDRKGRRIPIDDSAAPIHTPEGTVSGVVLVFRDISERKRAENELKQAERRFRTAISAVSDILWTNNAEGKMEGEQTGWADFTGQSREEYQGYGWSNAVHPDDAQPTIQEWNKAVAERRKFAFQHRVRRHDGVWRLCSICALPVIDSGEVKEWVGVHTDITDRKATEERLRALLNANPIGVVEGNVHGRVHEANDAFLSIIGYSRSDLLAGLVDWKALTAPEFRPLDDQAMAEAKEKGKCTPHEKEYVRKDGSRVPVYVGYTLLGEHREETVAFILDLTERKHAEKTIAESETRFRFMAETMPQKIFTAKPTGEVDYFNQQWTEFTGLSFEQIKDWGWIQFIHPDDVDENVRQWRHSINTGEPFQFLHRFRRADGKYRWHLSRARALQGGGGRVSMWIGSNTEIHEQKEQEEQLRRANEDLNQFAFAASHDLQEPLRMITIYSQLLVKGYKGPLDEETSRFVKTITAGTERMRVLLADLLAYTQVSADVEDEGKTLVDLNLVFEKALENCSATINDSDAVVTSDRLPSIPGHEPHFLQLFQNLISNAIKYRGGRVPRVQISASKTKEGWRLAVSDNGMGIDPKYHEQIFGVFKRLHGKELPGTGIGLAICKRVVDHYGGQIWVESQLDQGSTFYFTFPLMKGTSV